MMGWTADEDVRLRDLAGQGMSASQIATELGKSSRNAVIGRAKRQGIPLGNRQGRRGAADTLAGRIASGKSRLAIARKQPGQRAVKMGPARFELRDVAEVPDARDAFDPAKMTAARLLPVEGLREGLCKWPLYQGDEPRVFCGLGTAQLDGRWQPYCPIHSELSRHSP